MSNFQIEQNNNIEDIQTVDFDIDKLSQKFIKPIDNIRSSTIKPRVSLNKSSANNKNITISQAIINESSSLQVDFREPTESRCHAFYRLIGLPVMDDSGNFFNPGFNPDEVNNNIKHFNIVTSIPTLIKSLQQQREDDYKSRKKVFSLQGTDATAYTLALRYPKKFNLIENDNDPFDFDLQRFLVDDRIAALSSITKPDGSQLTSFFASGSHILKPFMVDPIIENTVMPGKNRVCVPFLKDKNSTRLERDIFLIRPILEFVCINRLIQPSIQQSLVTNLSNLTEDGNAQLSDSTLTSQDLQSIVEALLGDSASFDATNIIFATGGPSLVSLSNINLLIKQLKAVIKLLVDSMRTLDMVSSPDGITLFPIPNENGPEFGINLGKLVKSDSNTKLEKRILDLIINKEIAETSTDSTDQSKGQYAGSFYQNVKRNFKEHLDFANDQRNEYGRIASKAFRTIELVTGEISGLGLVDILALYIALWSIDTDALIALLDEDSFNRMIKFSPELITPEVQLRISSTPGQNTITGQTALTKLEQKVISVLTFADHLLEINLSSPNMTEAGAI